MAGPVDAKGKRKPKVVEKRKAARGARAAAAKVATRTPARAAAQSVSRAASKPRSDAPAKSARTAKPKLKAKSKRVRAQRVRVPRPKLRPDLVGASVMRIIAANADLHDLAGAPPLRRRAGGFEGLARIIVGQQLSVASAAAIWARTEKLVQPFTPARLLALSDAELASAGLSGPKIRTLRAIAQACVAGLDLDALAAASDAEVHDALTSVNGIGPWTADIYLMFCLGRADAWAPGDLALQIAAQQAFGLKQRPDKDELLEIAERWRPWRGVAARLLWAYYAVAKDKEKSGAVPV